jgi:hypothetical protein
MSLLMPKMGERARCLQCGLEGEIVGVPAWLFEVEESATIFINSDRLYSPVTCGACRYLGRPEFDVERVRTGAWP